MHDVLPPPCHIREGLSVGTFADFLLPFLLPLPRCPLACVLLPPLLLLSHVEQLFEMGFILRYGQYRGGSGDSGEQSTADVIVISVTAIIV